MKLEKFTYQDYEDKLCTLQQYRQSLNPPKIELGSIYIQAKGTWYEKHFKIIHIHNNIALALSVYNKISDKFTGDYQLFNVRDGFVYNDSREDYRLSEKVTKVI